MNRLKVFWTIKWGITTLAWILLIYEVLHIGKPHAFPNGMPSATGLCLLAAAFYIEFTEMEVRSRVLSGAEFDKYYGVKRGRH
jgi:hypothetical protein